VKCTVGPWNIGFILLLFGVRGKPGGKKRGKKRGTRGTSQHERERREGGGENRDEQ